MPLIKNKQVVANDPWVFVRDDEAVTASGDVLVTLPRFLAESPALLARAGRVGVTLEPTDEIAGLAGHVEKLGLIAVHFPKFGDGRGYSKARLLRERFGYKGELRAVGEVLGDQLSYMLRCGMDSFYLLDGKDVSAAIRCFDDFSVAYQAAADETRPLYRRVARGQAPEPG